MIADCLRGLEEVSPELVWYSLVLGIQTSIIWLLCQCMASIFEDTLWLSMAAGAPVNTSAF